MIQYPKPDRSSQTPNFTKTSENDAVDLSWGEGVLKDGRPFRVEFWCQHQTSFLTYFFSTIGIENFTESQAADFLEKEEFLKFTGTKKPIAANKWKDAIGNELWSLTVAVGDDDETFLRDNFSLQSYKH